jgi:quercetin dioxygenase-like cupin family protein
MTASAFFVSHHRALRVANDNGPLAADVYHLPPQMQAGARRNHLGDIVLFVEEGIVEFMVGGAAGLVTAGGYVRIPAGTVYSFRNAGDDTARLVSRLTPPRSADTAA